MTSIIEEQNQPHQLERLGASSTLYLQAKRLLGLNVILSVPLTLVASGLVAFFPSMELYAALWGAVVTLVSQLVLQPAQKKCQMQAARVQHAFDCELLKLNVNDFMIEQPEPEVVFRSNKTYQKQHPSYEDLKNWYPQAVGLLPIELARLLCQRTNCWWDSDLRRKYASRIIALVTILSVVVLLIGFIGGLTLTKFFLAVVFPLVPAVTLGINQHGAHMDSATALDQLRGAITETWHRALEKRETTQSLYQCAQKFQERLFRSRANSPLIFNWFYQLSRPEKQESMEAGAKRFADEAIRVLGLPNP